MARYGDKQRHKWLLCFDPQRTVRNQFVEKDGPRVTRTDDAERKWTRVADGEGVRSNFWMRCGRDLLAFQPWVARRRKSEVEKFKFGGKSGRLVAGSTAGNLGLLGAWGLKLRAAALGPSVFSQGWLHRPSFSGGTTGRVLSIMWSMRHL